MQTQRQRDRENGGVTLLPVTKSTTMCDQGRWGAGSGCNRPAVADEAVEKLAKHWSCLQHSGTGHSTTAWTFAGSDLI